MKPNETRSISVVMPAYNAAHYMPLVLEPLLDMLRQGEIAEILVVDDRSTDDTAAVAAKLGARVLTTPKNGGPGAARNFAAQHATGDILWLVDSDVIAHPGGAAQIAAAFADPGVHAVFGSYDDSPAGKSWMSQYKNLMHRYYHQRARREATTFWAGCGALRKSAFLAVGGFDVETYTRPSIEDIELGYRIRSAGGRILLLPDLLGKHLKIWTVRNAIHTDIFCRAIPWSRLMIGREGLTDDLNTSRAERGRAVLAGLWLLSILIVPFALTLWWLPFVLLAVVVVVNWPLFGFLYKAGGLGVAVKGGLYHQLYYVYSSAAFAYCLAESVFRRNAPLAARV
jgi:glycosyltransferase involved in cell wall biosynthesis